MSVENRALEMLNRYDWPGNVRELRNLTERIVILCPNHAIDVIDLPEEIYGKKTLRGGMQAPLKDARQEFESRFIVNSLKANSWNITETAKQLGIERTHLHRKMRQYDIERET